MHSIKDSKTVLWIAIEFFKASAIYCFQASILVRKVCAKYWKSWENSENKSRRNQTNLAVGIVDCFLSDSEYVQKTDNWMAELYFALNLT